ncbi:MAG: hypothetical protein P4L59_13505 [Desulfosporosinus sp.]|nr:hypothetical protein [Desulfosporosinus sp.]
MEKESDQEMVTGEQIPLIDILYKDTYRIDSFLAQITSGVLRSVRHQQGTTQGSSKSAEGNIAFLKGGASGNQAESKWAEQISEPHDNSILNLLDNLDLQAVSTLPDQASGKLIHFQGNIFIRNLSTMLDIVNLMIDTPQLANAIGEDAKSIGGMIEAVSKVLQFGLEIELLLDDKSVIIGNLKEKYLMETHYNLLKSYGMSLPGKWNVIGVVDDNKENSTYTSKNGMRSGLDQYSSMLKNMYLADTSGYILTPILIFRELNK